MKPTLRVRPRLEQLEDRCTPAVNIVFDGSNLSISGDPGPTLDIIQNAADVTVVDSFGSYGPFAVSGNISASLSNSVAARTITLALGANSTTGTVAISTGNVLGGNTVAVTGAGSIAGDFRVTGSSGDELVDIQEASIAGSVTLYLGAQQTPGFDLVLIGSTVSVAGNVTGIGVDRFFLDPGSNVSGSVILNTASVTANLIQYFLDEATIGGNVYIITGPTTITANFDINATIAGSVTLSLGSQSAGGSNTIILGSPARVGGSLTIVGRNAFDNVTLLSNSIVLGNVYFVGGNGNDTLTLQGTVAGRSIIFNGGNGGDDLIIEATASMAAARLFAYLGNGRDTVQLDRAATLASAYFDYGNGVDQFIPFDLTGSGLPFRYRIRHRNK